MAVIDRHVFYNNSAWDGNSPAANAADDAAVAPDKNPLLPGGTATFANYSSYGKGVNGVMIDIAGLPGTSATITAADFQPAWIIIAMIGATASMLFWRMPVDAGAEVSRRSVGADPGPTDPTDQKQG